ncbi:methyltransferase domain-containing protein [Streptomyces sp. NPDC056796]|uniref:methyltransferase domain-containing protein n=1 Tax=Streptomyces sp. NPDC056796 TaxID=3345947 RepID=UPI0036B441B5
MADVLAGAPRPDGRGRLVDVGRGPGVLAVAPAHLFREVVGVDPDGDMLTEAGHAADLAGIAGRARRVRVRAEELPAGLGTFGVAAFGRSFHRMDRDLVAAASRDMLEPGGSLVHVSDLKAETRSVEGLPCPAVPYAAMDGLVRHYLGPVRRAGRGVLPRGTPGGEAAVFTRAGFTGPRRHVVPGGQALVRTYDDDVAGVFSLSSSAPRLFGARRARFEADLRQLLREASPSGGFSARVPSTEVFVRGKDGAAVR